MCVLAKNCFGVLLVDHQYAVEEFAANVADEAFGDGIGPWRTHRGLDDADVDGGEDGVKGGRELGVAVPDEEPEPWAGVVEVHEQVAGLLDKPGAGGVGGDAEQVDPAGGVLDDEERVQTPETGGVEVEQVAGEDRLCLCAEELRPARSCSPRRGVDAGPVQDGPDGRGADSIAEAGEFAVDGESAWGAVGRVSPAPFPQAALRTGRACEVGRRRGGSGLELLFRRPLPE